METKWIKYFILSAGGILLAAALIRLLIALGATPILALPEPMLGIPLRYAVLIVGALELTVALFCLFGRQLGLQIGWLVWFSTNYLIFWLGLVWEHGQLQGSCFGTLTDPLRLSYGFTGYILEFIPIYLVFGSYAAGLWFWFSQEARTARLVVARQHAAKCDAAAGLLKMLCPSCGGHIKFASQNIGQSIPCPHCRQTIALSKPDNLKMSCFFCQGHIEFPPHAIGEKMPCPHCKMDITLKEPA
jgi:hypothetical protein